MPIRAGERPGLGGAVRSVADRARSLVQLEIQLAVAELKRKVVALGLGIGLVAGAALFGLLALLWLLAGGTAAIALALPVWASVLIVGGGLLLLSGLLGTVGLVLLKKGAPPVPEQAIAEARLTAEALKNGK